MATVGNALTRFFWIFVSCVSILICRDFALAQPPGVVHGTIVVVVSTKDGFVLAGDSRGTDANCKALPGEYEKVFSIGKRSGIVVAGLLGDRIDEDVAESLTKRLDDEDHDISKRSPPPEFQATAAMGVYLTSLNSIMHLLDTSEDPNHLYSRASAVSINEEGLPEWVTVRVSPVRETYHADEEHWMYRIHEIVIDPPESRVVALGSGEDIVMQMVNRSSPDPGDPNSQEFIMRHYYLLKQQHRLSELTLGDGELLARLLVETAISFANAHPATCYGIGGDIQMLAITREGANWVLPLDKTKLEPPISSHRVRILNTDMIGRLDGAQWVRGTIHDEATVTFSGDADVVVSQPKFSGGKCTFVLLDGAEEKMPETASRLRALFAPQCDVYRQTFFEPMMLSAAPVVKPHPDNDEDTSLCNDALKSNARELAAQLRTFVSEHLTAEQQISQQDWLTRFNGAAMPGVRVRLLDLRQELLREDRENQFYDAYERRFVPKAISIRHELIKRVPLLARVGNDAGHRGRTYLDMYGIADDLDALANMLPEHKCFATLSASKNQQ